MEQQERLEHYKRLGYDFESERDAILQSAMPVSGRILEIGTGKGYFTAALAKLGYSIHTVDISAETQTLAKETLSALHLSEQVTFEVCDAMSLPYDRGSFDAVFSVNTLHHFKNPFPALNEMLRVVSSGGKVVISEFTAEGFVLVDRIHRMEGGQHHPGYVPFEKIENYLEHSGECDIWKYKRKYQETCVVKRK